MKKYVFIILLLSSANTKAQSITTDVRAISFMVYGNDIFAGTGFVLNTKRQVVTCAHVIDTSKNMFFVSGKLGKNPLVYYKLRIIKLLPKYDLAVLESDEDLCRNPLIAADEFDFSPNQHLFYFGYNYMVSTDSTKALQVNNAFVSSVGKTFDGETKIDFIEFKGVGIPGYSGGPVLNDQGKVVGIMREAWLKQGIKGGQVELINRAFSIQPIIKQK
jgi:S1-C subfamily serine protease